MNGWQCNRRTGATAGAQAEGMPVPVNLVRSRSLPASITSAGGSFAITLVDLYLDAGGNADAVWVFQTASTLVVGTDRSVILAGGAQAKNVFWNVGSAATINGGAHMVGTIIASAGVTFPGGGATLDGRALSLVSAISFLNTTVNVPAP